MQKYLLADFLSLEAGKEGKEQFPAKMSYEELMFPEEFDFHYGTLTSSQESDAFFKEVLELSGYFYRRVEGSEVTINPVGKSVSLIVTDNGKVHICSVTLTDYGHTHGFIRIRARCALST